MLQRRTLQKSVQIAINDSSLKKNARTSKSDEKMFEKSFLVNCTAKEAENEFYITERALNKNCIELFHQGVHLLHWNDKVLQKHGSPEMNKIMEDK